MRTAPVPMAATTAGASSLARLALAAALLLSGRPAAAQFGGMVVLEARPAAPSPAPAQPAQASPDSAPPKVPTLFLTNGGFVAGALEDSDRPGRIRWRGDAFASPFDFLANDVNAIHYPSPPEVPKPAGAYCFELAGGDVLFGDLLALDEKQAELQVARLGRMKIARSKVERIYRWRDSADLLYTGPNGLEGWREEAAKKGWREDGGQLVSNVPGASIAGDFRLPARASLELEISWKDKPDFDLALGVDGDAATIARAFHFEVWGADLVAQRETEDQADLASIQSIRPGAGRVQLQAFLDQERGRMLVFAPNGRRLADLTVAERTPRVHPGIHLTNKGGEVRLEKLRISRWNGEAPREVQAEKSRVHLADGTIVYGRVTAFDAGSKAFLLRGESGDSKLAAEKVSSVYLALDDEKDERTVRVVYQDGNRLSGALVKVDRGEVVVVFPGVDGPLRLPHAGLRSLVVAHHVAMPTTHEVLGGTLEMEGVKLSGRLVDARDRGEASCLAWKPRGSDAASPLRAGRSGRIVYRVPPPAQPARQVVQQPQQGIVRLAGPFRALLGGSQGAPSPSNARRGLHLRIGDFIPCEVTGIDEKGVTFKSPISDSTFVAHDKVKAVELAPVMSDALRLNRAKRDRLLTLPRMQKDSPPTHMLRSRNGDYLRGRIFSMSAKTVEVEVRLETKSVPRDRIARIIWLHPDELDAAKKPASPASAPGTTRVQALRSDGIRLTFLADRMEDAALSGKSDVLGSCRVPLKEVDQILIGGEIEKAAAQLAYQQWKLRNAVEPKVSQADPDGSPMNGAAGTESALVGKPAPDFRLDLLDGKGFQLAKTRGQVVVLDFWATWCGPCIQAMPQVERVTDAFKDQGVMLVAVNLQEEPKQIAGMLERHKLHPTVALDRDGVVAEKYGATAIPQTVIIDRKGNVARLFVGGGPHLEAQLREAIQAVLKGEAHEPAK